MELTVPKPVRVVVYGSSDFLKTNFAVQQLVAVEAEFLYMDIETTNVRGLSKLSAYQKLPKKKAQWKQEVYSWKGKKR